MGKTGIVTVLYNSTSVLPDFFRSLDGQTCRDFTLYVVDNASPDDSLQQAERLACSVSFKSVFIRNSCNAGIGKGNNLGVEAARQDGCEWIILSNNDTVWSPDTFSLLEEEARFNRAEVIVPKILQYDTGRIWYAGGCWNPWRGGTRHYKKDKFDSSATVEYAPTCCMMISATVFDRIGGFDERFFLYYDDSDFVRRAGNAGIKIWYTPLAVIMHKEGGSVGRTSPAAQYWLSRNLLLYTYKHFSKTHWYYVILVHLSILLTKRLFMFGRSEWMASWHGLGDGIRICRKKQPAFSIEKAWEG